MTKEELKQEANLFASIMPWNEQEDTWEDIAERAYIKGAEPREKRIADLEQKLEQTEKDLADYQFNYPTIKELEKENAELKEQLNKNPCVCNTEWHCNDCLDQLTKAKEILQIVLDEWKENRWILQSDKEVQKIENLMEQAEQLLKE